MTKQETFDIAVKGILKQGKPSRNPAGASVDASVCRYRTPDGLKCAAGMLIPDDRYLPEMDRGGALCIGDRVYRVVCDELGHDFGLVKQLQLAHDGIGLDEDFLPRFKAAAQRVARLFGLDPKESL